MKYLLYIALFVTGLAGLWSCNEDTFVDPLQLTTIRGRVLFSANQQPARRATVRLTPGGRVVTTDSAGAFRFDSVLVGSYTVQATLTGYGTEVATVVTSVDTSPLLTILLTDDRTQNRPPGSPTLVAPAISSTTQSNTVTLKWTATDPNRDTLTYDVLLYRGGSTTPTSSFTGLRADSLVVGLDYDTPYLWQVIVKDGVNTVNGPVWSFRTGAFPTYTYLFTRRINNQFQIFGSNATGGAAQFTREGSNWRPIGSPNGQLIAYVSNVDTDLHLYIMNTDGSNKRRVTTVPLATIASTDLSFSWSPDGTQLLYPSNNRLYAVRLDGTGLRILAQAPAGRVFAGCDWTPQGNRIVARTTSASVYDNEISIYPAEGGVPTSILVRQANRVGNPAFSVDGKQIVFTIDVSGFQNEQGRQLDSRMFIFDTGSGALTDLSLVQNNNNQTQNKPAGTNDLDPRFSPTGSQLIFTNTDNTGNGVRSVLVSDLDGRNRRQLISPAEMPYWR